MSILNKIKDKIRYVINLQDSPKNLALSFGTGVFIGISPLLGIHTALGIAAAFIFRLNKFATIAGVYITNPWTIIPIYTFTTWFGTKIMHSEFSVESIDWHDIQLTNIFESLEELLMPFVIGSTIIAIICGILSGIAVYYIYKIKRAKPAESAAPQTFIN